METCSIKIKEITRCCVGWNSVSLYVGWFLSVRLHTEDCDLTVCSLVAVLQTVVVNICISNHIPINLQHLDDFVLLCLLKILYSNILFNFISLGEGTSDQSVKRAQCTCNCPVHGGLSSLARRKLQNKNEDEVCYFALHYGCSRQMYSFCSMCACVCMLACVRACFVAASAGVSY